MRKIQNFDKAFRQLTPALAELYAWLEMFQITTGYTPTRKEIAKGMDRHISTVNHAIIALAAKGFLKRRPTGIRNIELIKRHENDKNRNPLSPVPNRSSIAPSGEVSG